MSERSVSAAPRNSGYRSKKSAFLMWTLLASNLLLLIIVVRVSATYRGKCTEYIGDREHFAVSDPPAETTAPYLLNNTPGHCRPCPHQWIQSEEKCYFFSEKKKTKEESEKSCHQMGARLATVKDGVILRLATIMEEEFWVGLSASGSHYHEDSWIGVWSDQSTVSIRQGSGTCAKLGRGLMLENCYKELCWICEKDV